MSYTHGYLARVGVPYNNGKRCIRNLTDGRVPVAKDEEEMVNVIAIWLPATKAELERWLDLELGVEESSSPELDEMKYTKSINLQRFSNWWTTSP